MSLLAIALSSLLLASTSFSASLVGAPTRINVAEKVLPHYESAKFFPDGKVSVFREDPASSENWIINIDPDFRLRSTSPSLLDITEPAGPPGWDYTVLPAPPNYKVLPLDTPQLPSFQTGPHDKADGNDKPSDQQQQLGSLTLFKLPTSQTGLRGDGEKYDQGSVWLFNWFRLSETSDPSAPPEHLIGFEHNEDHYDDAEGVECTYKSIAVRYSTDLGLSWTRSLPIITKDKQPEPDTCTPFMGTGDFAAHWNPERKEWIILAQEGPLVMSNSSSPTAEPGTWGRYDPVSETVADGFIADKEPLAHGDLKDIAGSNPSIIFDELTKMWHVVYAKWGGGIAYSKSGDLRRWDKPVLIVEGQGEWNVSKYPSLVGSEGDVRTKDGKATLYFTGENEVDTERPLWSVVVDLQGGEQVPVDGPVETQ